MTQVLPPMNRHSALGAAGVALGTTIVGGAAALGSHATALDNGGHHDWATAARVGAVALAAAGSTVAAFGASTLRQAHARADRDIPAEHEPITPPDPPTRQELRNHKRGGQPAEAPHIIHLSDAPHIQDPPRHTALDIDE